MKDDGRRETVRGGREDEEEEMEMRERGIRRRRRRDEGEVKEDGTGHETKDIREDKREEEGGRRGWMEE